MIEDLAKHSNLLGTVMLGIGASALANIVTREVQKKKGFRPAVITAMLLTIIGASALYYSSRPSSKALAAVL